MQRRFKMTDENLNMDDLDAMTIGENSKYIKLEKGVPIELTVEKMEKIQDPKFALSNVDYKIRITTQDEKLFDITAWSLFKEVKSALKEAQGISGVKIRIERKDTGKYKVDLISTPYDGEEKVG